MLRPSKALFASGTGGRNKVRLIAAIHYNCARICVLAVLTHGQYDHGKWREEYAMQTGEITAALGSWPTLSPLLCVPHTEEDYENLAVLLDRLVDEMGEDESYSLASLMEIVGGG